MSARLGVILFILAVLTLPVIVMAAPGDGQDPSASGEEAGASSPWTTALGYLSAALAVGLGSIGAGLAVGPTASAAIGAVAEREEMAGKALIFVGLAEGIAIYGMVVAIMILVKL